MPSPTLIQTCGLLSLLCGMWNLYGDLFYLDHYRAHMSMDGEFGEIRRGPVHPGRIFAFDDENYSSLWMYAAQAGGWMYPLWGISTALPLYIGLQDAGYLHSVAPSILFAYGMCVMGGGLHSAWAFLTVLPETYHQKIDRWESIANAPAFGTFLGWAQSKIVEHIGVGCLVGYVCLNASSAWIGYVVATRRTRTKFPSWFLAFHPFVTLAWISSVSFLLPDDWGFYLLGCLGTWSVLFLNVGATFALREDRTDLESLLASGASKKGD